MVDLSEGGSGNEAEAEDILVKGWMFGWWVSLVEQRKGTLEVRLTVFAVCPESDSLLGKMCL